MSVSEQHTPQGFPGSTRRSGPHRRSEQATHQKLAFVENKSLDFQRIEAMLKQCSEANRWANKGPLYDRLADSYSEFFDIPHDWTVVPCANCGIGLEALARLLSWRQGYKLRWVAPSYSFLNLGRGYFGDVMFSDCDPEGLLSLEEISQLDPESFDGIIVINPFGIADRLDPYIEFAEATGKKLIIDNACGIGQTVPDWPWQSFSLHHTKPFGFGEGGLTIVPSDAAEEYYSLIDYGSAPQQADTWLGNGKISEVACAFHIERLEQSCEWVPQYMAQTERITHLARRCGLRPLKSQTSLPPTTSLPFLSETEIALSQIENSQHVMFAKYYKPHAATPNATEIFNRVINIPTHADMILLSDDQILSDLDRIQEQRLRFGQTTHWNSAAEAR